MKDITRDNTEWSVCSRLPVLMFFGMNCWGFTFIPVPGVSISGLYSFASQGRVAWSNTSCLSTQSTKKQQLSCRLFNYTLTTRRIDVVSWSFFIRSETSSFPCHSALLQLAAQCLFQKNCFQELFSTSDTALSFSATSSGLKIWTNSYLSNSFSKTKANSSRRRDKNRTMKAVGIQSK